MPLAAAEPPASISFLGVYSDPVDLSISATLASAEGEDAIQAAAADVVVIAASAALLEDSGPCVDVVVAVVRVGVMDLSLLLCAWFLDEGDDGGDDDDNSGELGGDGSV